MDETVRGQNCPECNKPPDGCNCGFDFIFNVPGFLANRAKALDQNQQQQLTDIKNITLFLNYVIENLPHCYSTRSGCVVEEHGTQQHSKHDSSRLIGILLVTELNELIINMGVGAYNSSIRTLRSMIEWVLKTVAAVSDRSIFSCRDEDLNRSMCFNGLQKTKKCGEIRKKFQRQRKINSEIQKCLEEIQSDDPMFVHSATLCIANDSDRLRHVLSDNDRHRAFLNRACRYQVFLAYATIPDGIGKIPKKLNNKIMSSFKIRNPETGRIENGAAALYTIYDILSQHVHNSFKQIEQIPYGAKTPFRDPKSFNRTCAVIWSVMDAVLYFYMLLIDIDVVHTDVEDRKKYRKFIQETFEEFLEKQKFCACSALFDSKMWNDSNNMFAIDLSPARIQHSSV